MLIPTPLVQPINLKRRQLVSKDPYLYWAEMLEVSNTAGLTGLGEQVASRELAYEIAELHLALLEGKLPLHSKRQEIPVAAMLESVDLESALAMVNQGFQTLKFKVGKHPIAEAKNLRRVRHALGQSVAIRLDANRAFSLEAGIQFGKMIQDLNIAYFEEPIQDYRGIPEFYQATCIPVALDETLVELITPPALNGVSTYALKPFLMPNLLSIARCIQRAYDQNLDIAICSAFEHPLSVNWLVVLCGLLPREPLAAGLSTLRWFEGFQSHPSMSFQQALADIFSG